MAREFLQSGRSDSNLPKFLGEISPKTALVFIVAVLPIKILFSHVLLFDYSLNITPESLPGNFSFSNFCIKSCRRRQLPCGGKRHHSLYDRCIMPWCQRTHRPHNTAVHYWSILKKPRTSIPCFCLYSALLLYQDADNKISYCLSFGTICEDHDLRPILHVVFDLFCPYIHF